MKNKHKKVLVIFILLLLLIVVIWLGYYVHTSPIARDIIKSVLNVNIIYN